MSKLTKEHLHGMSDFEVNKALAIVQGRYAGEVGDWMPNGVKVNDESGLFYSEMNYCNTPNDIMPLAFEYELNIHKNRYGDPEWICSSRTNRYFEHANPLLAIACCLILVLQEGK